LIKPEKVADHAGPIIRQIATNKPTGKEHSKSLAARLLSQHLFPPFFSVVIVLAPKTKSDDHKTKKRNPYRL
jgi:hypothetical protein